MQDVSIAKANSCFSFLKASSFKSYVNHEFLLKLCLKTIWEVPLIIWEGRWEGGLGVRGHGYTYG